MKLTDIVLEIREEVPDAPPEFCEGRFIRATREFLRQTRAWRDLARVTGSIGTDRYLLLPPDGSEVSDVMALRHNGTVLEKSTTQRLRRLQARTGTPDRFVLRNGEVQVYPDPGSSIAKELHAEAALVPSRDFSDLPDELYDLFGDTLLSGAVGRLMLMPNRPWTAFDVGRMHLTRFSEEVERWQAKAPDDGLVGVPRRVAYGGY